MDTSTYRQQDEPAMATAAPHEEGKNPVRQMVDVVVDEVKRQVSEVFDRQKRRTAETIEIIAGACRNSSRQLYDGGHNMASSYADSAAGRLETLSNKIRSSTLEDLTQGSRELMRRRPAVVLSAAVVVGFAAYKLFSRPQQKRYHGGSGSEPPVITPEFH